MRKIAINNDSMPCFIRSQIEMELVNIFHEINAIHRYQIKIPFDRETEAPWKWETLCDTAHILSSIALLTLELQELPKENEINSTRPNEMNKIKTQKNHTLHNPELY